MPKQEAKTKLEGHEREKVGLEDARRGEDLAQAGEEQEGHAGREKIVSDLTQRWVTDENFRYVSGPCPPST